MSNNFGYRQIYQYDEANLKQLNDTLRAMWKKVMGGIETQDLAPTVTTVVETQVIERIIEGEIPDLGAVKTEIMAKVQELVDAGMTSITTETISEMVDEALESLDIPSDTGTQLEALSEAVSGKASQSDLNALTSTVNGKASQSDLNALSSTVSGKASQSDLNALSTAVNGKASQADLTALTGTVSGKASQSDLDALSSTVSGKASQSDLNALSTAVNGKASQSALNALSTTVNGKASQTDMNALGARVSAIRIGGTNLLANTKTPTLGSGLTSWRGTSGTYCKAYTHDDGFNRLQIVASGLTDPAWYMISSPMARLPAGWVGHQLTLSFDLAAINWASVDYYLGVILYFYDSQAQTETHRIAKFNLTVPGQAAWGAGADGYSGTPANGAFKRVWTTYTLTADQLSQGDTSTFANCTHVFASWQLGRNGDIRIRAPKLEWGNAPTAWSPAPAPEDLESRLTALTETVNGKASAASVTALATRMTSAEISITQQAGQIATKVSQTDFNSLGTRVSNAESSITQQAGQIATKVSQTDFDSLGTRVSNAETAISQTAEGVEIVASRSVGGTQLLPRTKLLPLSITDISSTYSNPAKIPAGMDTGAKSFWRRSSTSLCGRYTHASGFARLYIEQSGAGSDSMPSLYSPVIPLDDGWYGRPITFSCLLSSPDWTAVDRGLFVTFALADADGNPLYFGRRQIVGNGDGQWTSAALHDPGRSPANDTWRKAGVTFTLTAVDISNVSGTPSISFANCPKAYVSVNLRRNGRVVLARPILEWGNVMTDWAEYRDDIAEAASASLKVTSDSITATVSSVADSVSAIEQKADNITLSVKGSAGRQLIPDTDGMTFGSGADFWRKSSHAGIETYKNAGRTRLKMVISGETEDKYYTVSSPVFQINRESWTGKKIIFSTWLYSGDWTAVDRGVFFTLNLAASKTTTRKAYKTVWNVVTYGQAAWGAGAIPDTNSSGSPISLVSGGWRHVAVQYTLSSDDFTGDTGDFGSNTHMWVSLGPRRNGDVRFYHPKLEWGELATDWSPAPEDVANGIYTGDSGVEVKIDKNSFSVDVPGDLGDLQLDPQGAKMGALTITDNIEAPNVAPLYTGPSTITVVGPASNLAVTDSRVKTLSDAFAKLNNRWLGKSVVISLAAGTTINNDGEVAILYGVHGGGNIQITNGGSGSHAKMHGRININNCSVQIQVLYLDITNTGNTFVVSNCPYVRINNCVLRGNNTANSYGVLVQYHASVTITDCQAYDFTRSFYLNDGDKMALARNKGNCRIGVQYGLAYVSGTQPCDQTSWVANTAGGGQVFGTATVDQGTSPTGTVETISSAEATAEYTDSYGARSWTFLGTELAQGMTSGSDGAIEGCVWFPDSLITTLTGKTIKSASLRLTQKKGYGRRKSVAVELYGTSTAHPSGASSHPSGNPPETASYGLIGYTEPGEAVEMSIPAAAISDLVAGTTKALMLKSGDSALFRGTEYSSNYARFYGASDGDAATKPRLTVYYATT